MPPVSTRLIEPELIHKALAGRDGALCDAYWTVLVCRALLEHTVEMKRCALVPELVHDIDLDRVTQGTRDWRVGPLPVDADEWPREAIGSCVYPPDVPVVGDDLTCRE